jgi:hypothetical protein
MISAERLKAARKELKRVGTSKATGDAFCFMYANMLAFGRHLSVNADNIAWPIPDFFEQIIGETDEQTRNNFLRLWRCGE